MSDFRRRISGAFDRLVGSMDDGASATVVTLGGVIWAVIDRILSRNGARAPVSLAANTSVTRVRVDDERRMSLVTFNDTTHLDDVPTRPGFPTRTVTLVRHGQTVGNQSGRWQGRSDSPLTDEGRRQVSETSQLLSSADAVYTSPLGRARASAGIIGAALALEPEPHDGLVEMSFGSWENLTPAEAASADPELYEAIYRLSEDRPRGGDGESFTDAGARMATAVSALTNGHGPTQVAAVSHGAIIRAFVTSVLGMTFAERHGLPVPRNSSMSRISYFDDGPYLTSYNVAPHLD
jgi:broad specificity phosphatase PhoE